MVYFLLVYIVAFFVCGEVRDLCCGVLFFDQGTYFIAFLGMVFFWYGNVGIHCFKGTEEVLPHVFIEEPSSAIVTITAEEGSSVS